MKFSSHRSLQDWPTNHNRATCQHGHDQIDRGCIGQIVSRSNSTKAGMPGARGIMRRANVRSCDMVFSFSPA
jgi:hypothetical protein